MLLTRILCCLSRKSFLEKLNPNSCLLSEPSLPCFRGPDKGPWEGLVGRNSFLPSRPSRWTGGRQCDRFPWWVSDPGRLRWEPRTNPPPTGETVLYRDRFRPLLLEIWGPERALSLYSRSWEKLGTWKRERGSSVVWRKQEPQVESHKCCC